MPCKPQKARKLLEAGKAKVVRKTPFTIKLTVWSNGYKQPIEAGMDTGSKTIGTCAVVERKGIRKVVYQAETHLRGEEVKRKMEQRRMYRRTRRGKKTRYRKPRFLNRRASRKLGRLPPSVKHKVEAHLREKKFIESILPITNWNVELASFDIHALTSDKVSKKIGWTYQKGEMYKFQNVKQFVLSRDKYTCQDCKKKPKGVEMHVHHVQFKSNGGTNSKDNLIVLCKPCHNKLHKKINAQEYSFKLAKNKKVNTKHATETSVIASQIRKHFGEFKETFGFITKIDRMENELGKEHFIDAAMIASKGMPVMFLNEVLIRRLVSKGDYKQTSGAHSEKNVPTGKLFGLRKFDLIQTSKGTGFVKGKRSRGYFVISDIFGKSIHNDAGVKKDTKRLSARSLIISTFLPALKDEVSSGEK